MPNYPATSCEVTRDDMVFKPGVEEALLIFKTRVKEQKAQIVLREDTRDETQWQEAMRRREELMRALLKALATAQGIKEPRLTCQRLHRDAGSEASSYLRPSHEIIMDGRLSIITLLHEFAHAVGMEESDATGWSASLFKRIYPRQYAKLTHEGHMLYRN